MIEQTKSTLTALEENKKVFEDPINFDPYRSNFSFNTLKLDNTNRNSYFYKIKKNNFKTPISSGLSKIRFFSPIKMGSMSCTSTTGFLLSDNKFNILNQVNSEKKNSIIIVDNDEDDKDNEKLLDEMKSYGTPKYSKKNINMNGESRRYSSSFIDLQMRNKLKNVVLKNKNILKSDVNNNEFDLSGSHENDKFERKKFKSSSKLIKVKKSKSKVSLFSSANKKDSSSKSQLSKREENKKLSHLNIKNKKVLLNMKKTFNYDMFKDPLNFLYDNIKNKQQIKKKDVDNIKKYFKSKGKNLNLNFNSIDIIKKANIITNQMDIERKTKRVFHPHLTYKHIQKLDDVTQINKKVHKLHIDYMNQLFDFKSKNSESIQAYL